MPIYVVRILASIYICDYVYREVYKRAYKQLYGRVKRVYLRLFRIVGCCLIEDTAITSFPGQFSFFSRLKFFLKLKRKHFLIFLLGFSYFFR